MHAACRMILNLLRAKRSFNRRSPNALTSHGNSCPPAEDDLDKLQADYEAVLRQSREAHERKYDQSYISDLTKRLDAANKSLRQFHLYGHMQ